MRCSYTHEAQGNQKLVKVDFFPSSLAGKTLWSSAKERFEAKKSAASSVRKTAPVSRLGEDAFDDVSRSAGSKRLMLGKKRPSLLSAIPPFTLPPFRLLNRSLPGSETRLRRIGLLPICSYSRPRQSGDTPKNDEECRKMGWTLNDDRADCCARHHKAFGIKSINRRYVTSLLAHQFTTGCYSVVVAKEKADAARTVCGSE
jgi:hypothetical protein